MPRLDFTTILSFLGTVASVIAFAYVLTYTLGFSFTLTATLLAALAAFLGGLFSQALTRGVRKLSRSRSVFVAFPLELSELAEQVAEYLTQSDPRIKLYLAVDVFLSSPSLLSSQEVIVLGTTNEIRPTREKAIAGSTSFVALISEVPSDILQREIDMATRRGVKVILAVTREEALRSLPDRFKDFNHVQLSPDRSRGLQELASQIE